MEYKRVVVKVGTNLLTTREGQVNSGRIGKLATQFKAVRDQGAEMLLVSSGAIIAGQAASSSMGEQQEVQEVVRRQALAAIGQPRLMAVYGQLFSRRGIEVAQALISRDDLQRRINYLNARDTLNALLKAGVLPIINENDVVSTSEISGKVYGDNDRLAAMVANAVDADLLILLGEMEGLYMRDPHVQPDAQLVEEVEEITPDLERAAGKPHDSAGSGGMASKLKAARLAMGSGTHMVIASGKLEDVVTRICAGERIGTRFVPRISHVEDRKRWMLTGFAEQCAEVRVDSGAAEALRKRGVSLLPAGIDAVEGEFARGDIVKVTDPDGKVVAFGLANYKSSALEQIKGLRSGEMEGRLERFYGEEAIHRNNLTLA